MELVKKKKPDYLFWFIVMGMIFMYGFIFGISHEPTYHPYDVNQDGYIDQHDIELIRHHILGTIELKGEIFKVADVNGDGKISIVDLALVKSTILKYDLNGDGVVDISDMMVIRRYMNEVETSSIKKGKTK